MAINGVGVCVCVCVYVQAGLPKHRQERDGRRSAEVVTKRVYCVEHCYDNLYVEKRLRKGSHERHFIVIYHYSYRINTTSDRMLPFPYGCQFTIL